MHGMANRAREAAVDAAKAMIFLETGHMLEPKTPMRDRLRRAARRCAQELTRSDYPRRPYNYLGHVIADGRRCPIHVYIRTAPGERPLLSTGPVAHAACPAISLISLDQALQRQGFLGALLEALKDQGCYEYIVLAGLHNSEFAERVKGWANGRGTAWTQLSSEPNLTVAWRCR